ARPSAASSACPRSCPSGTWRRRGEAPASAPLPCKGRGGGGGRVLPRTLPHPVLAALGTPSPFRGGPTLMLGYIARRLVSTVVVLAIVGVFVFMLLHLSPGDPAAIIAGDNASPEQIAGIRQRLGLDDPMPVPFLPWSRAVLPCVLRRL